MLLSVFDVSLIVSPSYDNLLYLSQTNHSFLSQMDFNSFLHVNDIYCFITHIKCA